jgi:S-adenosylmethionine:tRNA ribosyltransferase-isomerase
VRLRRRSSRSTFPVRWSNISAEVAPESAALFDYALPEALIAQHPAPRRDGSRLLLLDGETIAHRAFGDLPSLLAPDDLLVLNETRVIPARLAGERVRGGGRTELLLLHPADSTRYDPEALRWIALAKPARRLRCGDRIAFGRLGEARVRAELPEGMRELEFALSVPFERFLDEAGRMPLPPYIRNDSPEAQRRYQSVFARLPGSVAAPTASLHFTARLLREITRRGIEIVRLALDVGLGTFRPVTAASIGEHVMHAETYSIEPETARAIESARNSGRRIVAVGTTVVRALEGSIKTYGRIEPGEHVTDLFITPGFRFGAVGAMITNFHLPRSTLLMLVSAFAGRERVLRAYAEAIAQGYRFYSFGDAMFVTKFTS